MLFAHLKRVLGLDRLRLCGPSGAQFEFTLATIAQNLRRLAKIVSRPQPAIALGAAGSQRNRSSLDRRLLQRNRPISAGPLLSGESPVTETQRQSGGRCWFREYGLSEAIETHSLRSGFLTSAAARGASLFKMMDGSRHKSVDVLRGYVRDAEAFRAHAGSGLL
jgi:hypothetical protein